MTEKADYKTVLRLPPHIAAAVKRRAAVMRRSINEEMIVLILRGLVLDMADEEALCLANEKLATTEEDGE